MNYRETLDYLFSFSNFLKAPDLARMEQLLAALGNPHRRWQAIHIAGTKGKGSTSAMIASVLRTAGYRTGVYTSPHLHTFRERIRVNGEMISEMDVITSVAKLKPLIDTLAGIPAFEIMTALAFDYFAQRGVEIAVIEVGLGGRLDATNIVSPRVSVITSISYDHMAILGNTLAEIAREKAGIIKPNTPVVVSPQNDEARQVVEAIAQERNAPLIVVSPEMEFQVSGSKFQVTPGARNLDAQTFVLASSNLKPVTWNLQLLGHHQLVNAATALAALFVLREQGIQISNAAIATGLACAEWVGRFEILAREPVIVVDGAHNADSAHQLVIALRDYFPKAGIHLIFAASTDKDIEGMFAELLPHIASLTITKYSSPRSADTMHLMRLAAKHHVSGSIWFNIADALRSAREFAKPDDIICITGSLFLVAEARQVIFAERGTPLQLD